MLFMLRWAVLALAMGGTGAASCQALVNEPVRPLPLKSGGDPARVALGSALFNDVRFSRDNNQSCASCHQIAHAGTDGRNVALGPDGKPAQFNTPTVYNSSLNVRQGWTGSFSTIEQLLDHFLTRPKIYTSSWEMVAARLGEDALLSARFRAVYGDDVSPPYVKDALDQYLRSLVTPSRFDRYLHGQADAISADEEAGYLAFKRYGCVACHQGINLGGNMYQKLGAMRELPDLAASGADLGRQLLTGRAADRNVFRVPGLRNVALTAPYFHNGKVATLDEAVDAMFKYQLGRTASAQDKDLILRFLRTLSGENMAAPEPKR